MSIVRRSFYFFIPSIASWVVPLFLLPVTTLVLGPEEYGIFALVSSIVTIGHTLALPTANYVFSRQSEGSEAGSQLRMASPLLQSGILILIPFAAIVWIGSDAIIPSSLPVKGAPLAIALVAALCRFPWLLVNEMLTLQGQARVYAIAMIGQTLVAAVAVVVSLFVFKLGWVSLFVADLASGAYLLGIALWHLSRTVRWEFNLQDLKQVFRDGAIMVWPNLVGNLQLYSERMLISRASGLAAVGIYDHSKKYKAALGPAVGAVSRSVWPVSIQEVNSGKDFPITRRAWSSLYLFTSLAGVVFAAWGDLVIGLLTHDKFTAAHPFATLWIVHLVMQQTQRPQIAVMFTRGHGQMYSTLHLVGILLSLVVMYFGIREFGPTAAFVSFVIQEAIFRAAIFLFCRRRYGVGFFDHGAWIAILHISVVLALALALPRTLPNRMLLTLVASGLLFLWFRGAVRDAWRSAWTKIMGQHVER